MTTETKNDVVQGWNNTEMKVGDEVEANPEAEKTMSGADSPHHTPPFTLTKIYADGERVVIKSCEGTRIVLNRENVRPVLVAGRREEIRTEAMNRIHEQTRKHLQDFLYNIANAHRKWIEDLSSQESSSQLANRLTWKVEAVFASGAVEKIVHQYGIVKAVQFYIDGVVELGWLKDEIDDARKKAACDALRHPYKHSSTSAASNLYEEVEHRMLCSLADAESYGFSFSRELRQIDWIVKELEKVQMEW